MARTAAGAALTALHQRSQLALRAALLRDLARLWPMFDPATFGTFDRFTGVATVLLTMRHRDSAALAARYLSAFRMAEGVAGDEPVALAERPEPERIAASLRATGLAGTVRAVAGGQSMEAARRSGFVALAGAAGSLVLDGGRETITESAARDRVARGWQRVTGSDPCAFCQMLASRGAAYRGGETAAFEAHDHCACSAEIAYSGSALPPGAAQSRERWNRETEGLSGRDALNAFRRSIDAERRGTEAVSDGA
ncbi:MAG TPA: hypothetical protein VLH81_03680 [Desulfobacterales bacterium]|nr:hypothetical protein [Desulfobacterales bacterium]